MAVIQKVFNALRDDGAVLETYEFEVGDRLPQVGEFVFHNDSESWKAIQVNEYISPNNPSQNLYTVQYTLNGQLIQRDDDWGGEPPRYLYFVVSENSCLEVGCSDYLSGIPKQGEILEEEESETYEISDISIFLPRYGRYPGEGEVNVVCWAKPTLQLVAV